MKCPVSPGTVTVYTSVQLALCMSSHAKATSRAACMAPGYLFPFVLCHGAELSVITFFKWCQVCCFNMQGTL